jgi:hypothetical protein
LWRYFVGWQLVEEIFHQPVNAGKNLGKWHPGAVEFSHNLQIKTALAFVPQEGQVRWA